MIKYANRLVQGVTLKACQSASVDYNIYSFLMRLLELFLSQRNILVYIDVGEGYKVWFGKFKGFY